MNDDPSPNESISVDEMMERLRDKRRESEGRDASSKESRETVTRTDGSKVVRVRRRGSRKKTSDDSEEEKRGIFRNKWMLFAVIVLLIVFGGGSLGFYLYQSARLNSPDFADLISEKVGKTTDSTLTFKKLEINPTSVRAREASAVWGAGGIARDLKVEKIFGDLDGKTFLFGNLIGESITAKTGKLILEPKPKFVGGGYGAEIPQIFDFKSFRCNDLDIFWGEPRSAKMKLIGAKASLEFEGESDSKVFLQDGVFHSPIFGKMQLRQALIDFYPDHTDVASMVLQKEGSFGKVEASGSVLRNGQAIRSLDLALSEVDISTLTQNRLLTVIKDCRITATDAALELNDNGSWEISANGKASGFDLTALPFMGNLGILVDDNNLSVTHFKETTPVRFAASNDRISIEGLESERVGLFALKVDCRVVNGNQLEGTIKVGLASRYTERTTFMAKEAFSRVEGPYRWCDVTISGTINAPKDDSTKLFKISAMQRDEAVQRLLEAEIERQKERSRRMDRAFEDDKNDEPELENFEDPGDRFDELTR